MRLNFKEFGEGQPLLILHGLMGMLDNWQGPAKTYSQHFHTYIIDARNHGHSGHDPDVGYEAMMQDLLDFIREKELHECHLLGHSMGGKTVMKFTQHYPEYVDKLIVADISPRAYPVHHQKILAGLNELPFDRLKSRGEADKILAKHVADAGVRNFLLKSLYWREKGKLDIRFNLPAITTSIEKFGASVEDRICENQALFIRGSRSDYVSDDDWRDIRIYFPNGELETIEGAGHWLHAEKPEEFLKKTLSFLLD